MIRHTVGNATIRLFSTPEEAASSAAIHDGDITIIKNNEVDGYFFTTSEGIWDFDGYLSEYLTNEEQESLTSNGKVIEI
jgi:hypothetical protein